jgi:hypothetical protein
MEVEVIVQLTSSIRFLVVWLLCFARIITPVCAWILLFYHREPIRQLGE